MVAAESNSLHGSGVSCRKTPLLCLVHKIHMLFTNEEHFFARFSFLLFAWVSQLQNPFSDFFSYLINIMPFDYTRTT